MKKKDYLCCIDIGISTDLIILCKLFNRMSQMISFLPIDAMLRRVETAKESSDSEYFYDLLLLGEYVTKIITIFFVSCIRDDIERTRYRFEYSLVHADGIGDYASALANVLTGNTPNLLPVNVQDNEVKELTNRHVNQQWTTDAVNRLKDCLSVFDIDSTSITKKSGVYVWFQFFATLRNKTKGHGATTSEKSSKAAPLLDESIGLLLSNLFLFKRPWAHIRQNLSGSYRVSIIAGDQSCFKYLTSKNNKESLQEGVYCFIDNPIRLSLICSTPEITFFSVPCGGFKSTEYEVLDYVSDTRKMVDSTPYLLPPSDMRKSVTAGERSLIVKKNALANIPQEMPGYIMRPALEQKLIDILLEDKRFPVVTLKGRGGIGKTSLAVHVIHKLLLDDNRFDIVIWFSARDIDLSEDGPKQVSATVINKEDIALEYMRLISPDNKYKKEEAINCFTKELSQISYGKALYIFDNFETLTNPAEIYEWINNSIESPNKVLITSRLNRSFKADYPIEVNGMEEDECRLLIQETANLLRIEHLLSETYINKLITESEGHPYVIKIILGDVARVGKALDIKRIFAGKDRILEALFKRTYSSLSYPAQRVFLTLCSWASAIPTIALESVLIPEENERLDVYKALEELSMSSFIEIVEKDGEEFVNVPLAALIFGKSEIEVSDDKLQIMRDRKLLMEFGADSKNSIRGLEHHVETKLKAIARRISSLDDLENEIPYLEVLASRYPKAWLRIAELFAEYDAWEYEKAAYKDYIRVVENEKDRIVGWQSYLEACQRNNDWEGEVGAITGIVQIPNVPFYMISDAAQRITEYYYSHPASFNRDIKRSLVEYVISVMEKRIDEANADDYSRIAWLCLHINDEAKAARFAQEGLNHDPGNVHCLRLRERLASYF